MEHNTSIRYQALNEDSYNSLAAYAITTPATVSLFPELHIIVISESASKEIGEFIDNEGLSFHINPIEVSDENFGAVIDNPTTDSATLRNILYRILQDKSKMASAHQDALAEITKQKEATAKDLDMYKKWYYESYGRESRIKEQVNAIAVLMNSIFPKE